MERIIQEKSNSIALLQNQIEFLQHKGSLDAKEQMGKAHAQAGELEKQVDSLRMEIETQKKKKDALEARANMAEKKIHELNLKLESLQKVGDEQKTRISKTERLLKVAEEEMMKAKLEAASIFEDLMEDHRGWLPRWLTIHLGYFQSYIVTHWDEHGGPALDLIIQKALEKKAQAAKWAEPHIETIVTKWLPSMMEQWLTFVTSLEPHVQSLTTKMFEVYHASKSSVAPHVIKIQKMADHYIQGAMKFTEPYFNQVMTVTKPYMDKVSVASKPHTKKIVFAYRKFVKSATLYHQQVQEMLKNNDLTRQLATMELAWFAATALLTLPVIFLFQLYSAIFSKKTRKRSHTSHTNHTRRRPKKSHPEK